MNVISFRLKAWAAQNYLSQGEAARILLLRCLKQIPVSDQPPPPQGPSGKQLKAERLARGLTQAQLGSTLNVCQPTIVAWEQKGVPRRAAKAVLAWMENP